MRRAFLLIMAAVICAGCQSGPGSDPTARAAASEARMKYLACTLAQAHKLEHTAEPAETIAVAAIEACGREDVELFEKLRIDARDDRLAMAAMRLTRQRAYEGVVDEVIQIRSRRTR